MIDVLLVWWLALMGVTRVDLLAGASEFLLTPFLVLSPIIVVLGIGSAAAHGGAFRLPPRIDRFFLLVAALLAVILVSTFLAVDLETSARRTLLLFAQVISVLLTAVVLANRSDPKRLLVRGAVLGLTISLLFNVLQIAEWFTGGLLPESLAGAVVLEPGNYAGVVPRLTGAAHDPNLGGLLILSYLFLLAQLGRPSRLRTCLLWAGSISILLTLSRSAVLATLVLLIVVKLRQSGATISQRAALRGAGGIAVAVGLLLIFPALLEMLAIGWDLVGGRFSLGEGSSQEHAAVLARGIEVATNDIRSLILGIGYGNAYTTLQDIFPGNRYGNFHSLFVTLLAESGIIAAALGVVLFVYPLFRGGLYQPMIAALLVYNLFQQSQTDPITWLLLLLAWTGIGASGAVRRRSNEVAGLSPAWATGGSSEQPNKGDYRW